MYEDYNGLIWLNIGPGLNLDSNNKIATAVEFGMKFDNNRLSEMSVGKRSLMMNLRMIATTSHMVDG